MCLSASALNSAVYLIPFIAYSPFLFRHYYMSNVTGDYHIESVNMSLRKVTKSRGSFPNDESVMKLFYLALNNISKKWTMPLRDWKPALNRFTIQFEERMPQQ
ncbi:MAG: transposase [Methylotenera sp.]|nr:transposase [Methylotenera sp.]